MPNFFDPIYLSIFPILGQKKVNEINEKPNIPNIPNLFAEKHITCACVRVCAHVYSLYYIRYIRYIRSGLEKLRFFVSNMRVLDRV